MIEWMEIHGIKSVRKLRLDLRPVNVLVGSNGAGKSNFVGFFNFIHAIQLALYTAQRGGAGRMCEDDKPVFYLPQAHQRNISKSFTTKNVLNFAWPFL